MIVNYLPLSNPPPGLGSIAKKKRTRRRKYSHPKQQSMSVRILNMIEERDGMTTGQIKRALWEWSHPSDVPYNTKEHRGWWNTNLYGSRWHAGLLHKFCEKRGRRWYRNKVSHEDRPWAVIRRKQPKGQWSAQTQMGVQQIVMTYMPAIQMPSIKTIIAGDI